MKTETSNFYKRSLIYFILALGFVIVLYIFLSQFKKGSELTEPRLVAASKVLRADLIQTITMSAELVPYNEATLYAKVPGYLKKINVDIGDQVNAGDVLAILEVPELQDILAENKASYELALLEFKRINAIRNKRPELVAQDEVDKASARYEVEKAKYEHSKTMVSYSKITAPYDGTITERFVDEGAMIQQGTNTSTQAMPIVQIADNTKLRLIFPVPEPNVPFVNTGDLVEITIPVVQKKLNSTITRTARKVKTDTRTMEVQVDIENKDLKLAPGMYGFAKVYLVRKLKVLSLPISAVELSEKPTVWLINEKGIIEEKTVMIGVKTPHLLEILEGLNEGDTVIYGNRNTISPGMKVKPKLLETNPTDQKNK